MITARNELLPPLENEKNIIHNINDTEWFSEIPHENGVIFVGLGLFYYFTFDEVKSLFTKMTEHFTTGVIAFDITNKRGLKLMLKTLVKDSAISDIDSYFHIKDVNELNSWINNFKRVSSKSYMNGYRKLDDINIIYKLLNKLSDSYVGMNNELAKIHNFKSSWEEKLFYQKLSNKVYDTLIETTENNLAPLHRYYELTAKLQNKDKLRSYDLSLLDISSKDIKYSIEDAIELVKKATEPLGEEYSKKINKIFDNHYIDYCQYKGKQSGGYSISTYTRDSRILMSFNDSLASVSTIAHEGGHNVNHQYMLENS